jgi:glycosyltransferase involved in cell wall biosynthesis
MKIVQTPVRFYPAIGGVEKYVFDLSVQLVRIGHEITVVCANEPPSEECQVQGIQIKRLPYLFKIAGTNITPSLFFQLMKEDFEVIHTHFPTPWSAEISLICAKLRKKPCILTYHNDVEKPGFLGLITKFYNTFLLNLLLGKVDKILVTQPRYIHDSRFLTKHRKKISIITNGISNLPDASRPIRKKTSLLFVGILDNYHRYKGVDYLIEALRLASRDCGDIHLDVVGKGELVIELQQLARHLNVDQYIRFWGYVDHQKLTELYQTSTVFVLPSIDLHEGFGIVLLEAMAHGLPVVTTQVVGISNEIIEHAAGIIVPPKNPFSIAEAVNTLLSDPWKAQQMGSNGQELVRRKYLWPEITKEVIKIYEAVTQ